jgi:para-aminobenzoate synthetase component 1
LNKKIIEEQINKFGFEKEPFLFLISYDFKKFYIEKLSNLSNQIKYEINQKETKSNKRVDLEKFPITFEEYKKKFDVLQEEIKQGNSYLLNLTAKTKIKTTFNLEEIYKNTKSMFKLKVHIKFMISRLNLENKCNKRCKKFKNLNKKCRLRCRSYSNKKLL